MPNDYYVFLDGLADLSRWRRLGDFERVGYQTSIGVLRFLWLGPAGFINGPFAGTSPYLDWYLETHYVHRVNFAEGTMIKKR